MELYIKHHLNIKHHELESAPPPHRCSPLGLGVVELSLPAGEQQAKELPHSPAEELSPSSAPPRPSQNLGWACKMRGLQSVPLSAQACQSRASSAQLLGKAKRGKGAAVCC